MPFPSEKPFSAFLFASGSFGSFSELLCGSFRDRNRKSKVIRTPSTKRNKLYKSGKTDTARNFSVSPKEKAKIVNARVLFWRPVSRQMVRHALDGSLAKRAFTYPSVLPTGINKALAIQSFQWSVKRCELETTPVTKAAKRNKVPRMDAAFSIQSAIFVLKWRMTMPSTTGPITSDWKSPSTVSTSEKCHVAHCQCHQILYNPFWHWDI